jgi:hypothetical protein
MLYPVRILSIRNFSLLSCSLLLSAGLISAQTAALRSSSDSSGWSSSRDGGLQIAAAAAAPSGSALPSAPDPAGSAAGQRDRRDYGGGGGNSMSRLAFEVGAGINAPGDGESDVTWGGNFTLGAGYNFNRYFAMMAEYQFIHDKLPGRLISPTGATGGYDTIWSLTLDPVFDFYPHASNDVYITGGGGFYRKVTNFTNPQPAQYCDPYYGYCGITIQNVVIGHFSSNQGGVNIGMGYQHRFGGMYGESRAKFFAEARYLNLFSPAVVGITPSGLGVTTVDAGTRLIPVTVGIRF